MTATKTISFETAYFIQPLRSYRKVERKCLTFHPTSFLKKNIYVQSVYNWQSLLRSPSSYNDNFDSHAIHHYTYRILQLLLSRNAYVKDRIWLPLTIVTTKDIFYRFQMKYQESSEHASSMREKSLKRLLNIHCK